MWGKTKKEPPGQVEKEGGIPKGPFCKETEEGSVFKVRLGWKPDLT